MTTPIRRLHFRRRHGLFLLAALVAATSALPGCARNPVTGERQFMLFSESQEIQLGREADEDIVAMLGLYEDEQLARRVDEIGQRMAADSERPDLPWTFRVVDDPTMNAFALPGGFIYLTRGIIAHFGSEAEMAGVIGHEIGHVTARHGVVRVSRAQLAQFGLGLGMILAPDLRPFGQAAGVGLQLLFLSNSRDDERQADDLGIQYMLAEGYDPRALSSVFEMLGRASGAEDGDRIPGFLSTHPDPLDRRDRVLELIADEDLQGTRIERESYVRGLDGMVFGNNPREGYFENGLFRHPDLEFQVRFPQGWRTVNTRQEVQGVSPQEDAVILVGIASESSATASRQAFLGQSGVERGAVWSDPVGGLTAAWADFQVRDEANTVPGTVLFVEHDGRVYRILGYAREAAWTARRDAVVGALASFREETDPAVLGVEPYRIDIVEVPRAMTFAEFLREYPSTAPERQVGEINHLRPEDRIPAGTLVKRVVGGPGT